MIDFTSYMGGKVELVAIKTNKEGIEPVYLDYYEPLGAFLDTDRSNYSLFRNLGINLDF